MTVRIFRDRTEAGRELAGMLSAFARQSDVVVLALRRGRIPLGPEVARALRTPLDVFIVRKPGGPGYEELAMGAIAIGVIHGPDSERRSHYFGARLPDQFDANLHVGERRAAMPLERTSGWEAGEVPETFPVGL